jgi:hypothetical protein
MEIGRGKKPNAQSPSAARGIHCFMRMALSRIGEWRRLSAPAVIAAVLVAGALSKLGHAWSAIALLAVLCSFGAVFKGLIAAWRGARATHARRLRMVTPLQAQA